MHLTSRRPLVILLAVACAAPLAASREAARETAAAAPQAAREFTAEDMLKVSTASVLDLSDEGRRVAVGVRRAYDNAEVDNRRFGDPTYVAPSLVKVMVIDTASGAIDAPFKDLVNVRQAAWSHDGRRLALLTVANDRPPALVIWDAERKTWFSGLVVSFQRRSRWARVVSSSIWWR